MSLDALRVEPLTRFEDPRGALLKLHPGPVAGEVYAVTITPGQSRGHHAHRQMAESFTLLAGHCVLGVLDPATGEHRHLELEGMRITVPPGLAHALFNIGQDSAVVVACAERLHDPGDVTPHRVPPP